LSPERFGMHLQEIKAVCRRFIKEAMIDFLDISLWDSFKEPEEAEHKGKSLLQHFTEIEYENVLLTVAGQIRSAIDVRKVIDAGVDFVSIGRAAILHHDFPEKVRKNTEFKPVTLPVSSDYLRNEGLGEGFIEYMKRWPGFVQ